MKIYRLCVGSDNGFQALVDLPPQELLGKKLYTEYPFNSIDSIRLDLDRGAKFKCRYNKSTRFSNTK